jgi:Eukaryotic aspartyl protease.
VLVVQDSDFENMQADGILGMGLGYSTRYHHPVISNMISQNLISSSIFSVFLSNDNSGSSVIFGGYDLKAFSDKNSSLYYLKVIQDGY